MIDIKLSAEEKRAIRALEKLASIWPESLWLFSASGTLCVMKKDQNHKRVYIEGYGGADPNYVVADVNIENDGGDW